MTTELEQKIVEQAALIEKLRNVLGSHPSNQHTHSNGDLCSCSQCEFVRLKDEVMAIPTDSKQILQEWLDEVLGETFSWLNPYGGVLTKLSTGLERETFTIPLFKKPEGLLCAETT